MDIQLGRICVKCTVQLCVLQINIKVFIHSTLYMFKFENMNEINVCEILYFIQRYMDVIIRISLV